MTAHSLPDRDRAAAFLAWAREQKCKQAAPAPVVMQSVLAAPAPTNVSTIDERLAMACGIGGAREVVLTSNSVARTP